MKKRGFTLIELLVVIAIIAILAAILFPVFLTAKERGRQARCCANLKQLTMAFFGYCDDNNGSMPISQVRRNGDKGPEWTGSQWTSAGGPYPCDVRKGSLYRGGYARSVGIFNCPSDQNIPAWKLGAKMAWSIPTSWPPGATAADAAVLPSGFGLTYSLNEDLCDQLGASHTIKLSAATAGRTGQVLFLIHEKRGDSNSVGQNDGLFQWWSWSTLDNPGEIHWKGTTCSYADGHVKWISNGEIVKIMARCLYSGSSSGHPANKPCSCPWHRNSFYYGYGVPDQRYTE